MRLRGSPYVHLYPTSLQICFWLGGLFFFFHWILGENNEPVFVNNQVCCPKQHNALSWSRQEGKMPNKKTSSKNSTWVKGGKWAGWSQKQKTGNLPSGYHCTQKWKPRDDGAICCTSVRTCGELAGWGVLSTWRQSLEFFVSNPCWIWGLCQEKVLVIMLLKYCNTLTVT